MFQKIFLITLLSCSLNCGKDDVNPLGADADSDMDLRSNKKDMTNSKDLKQSEDLRQTDGGATTDTSDTSSFKDSGNTQTTLFPASSWMYQSIENAAIRGNSSEITNWLTDAGGWGLGRMQIDFSLEVLEAQDDTPYKSFTKTAAFYEGPCDEVEVPVPLGGALEGEQGYACDNDGDCHLIVIDRRNNRLYEMWRADIRGNDFQGGCLAAWDMTRDYGEAGRGEQCTSADAAGFSIASLLFSADDIAAGEINHAIRFILPNARMRKDFYVHPATHAGGPRGPASAPIYGSRWRLKADFDLGKLPNEGARVVARAMQKYGMALADGGRVALTGQSDRFTQAKWADHLGPRDLDIIEPTDFEIIDTGDPVALTRDCVRTPY